MGSAEYQARQPIAARVCAVLFRARRFHRARVFGRFGNYRRLKRLQTQKANFKSSEARKIAASSEYSRFAPLRWNFSRRFLHGRRCRFDKWQAEYSDLRRCVETSRRGVLPARRVKAVKRRRSRRGLQRARGARRRP